MLSAALALLLGAPAAAAPAPDPRVSVSARALKPGEAILVEVEGEDPKTPPAGELRGQPLSFFAGASTGSWLALAGVDLDVPPGPARLAVTVKAPGGKAKVHAETLALAPASFSRVELKVAQKYVTPAKTDQERAEGESSTLQRLFVRGEQKRLFEGGFSSPIPGAATARFGERRVFNGQPRAPHSGMDLKAKKGTPVKAPAAGRVALADSLFFQGNTIVLDHGEGLTTLYAHLSKIRVKPGELVKKGQVIGNVGATGRVTGPHLHWALKIRGARVDPYSLAFLDLDALLRPAPADPLKRSPACGSAELPPAPKWGRASAGLRGRARATRAAYAPGEPVSLLVELENAGKKPVFLDFVRDPRLRPLVLGVGGPPRRFELLVSSRAASGPLTEQVKIPKGRALCFEQGESADGPLLASATTWALAYGTEQLYPSTGTIRAGIWRGALSLPPVTIAVSTAAPETPPADDGR